MADISNITLPNGENYDIKDKAARNDIAINRTTLGYQCKNLLKLSHPFGYKYTNAAGTATWTFNNDYSVSMVANSKISGGVAISISEVTLKKGTYLYSVEGYSTPNITHTQLYSLNADGSWTWLANLSAIENKITVTEETTYSFRAYRNSLVTVGVTETLYPMLRSADITDSTFEPYSDNVDTRLIQNKSDIAVNKTTLGYQCKNLLKNTAKTSTMSGVTFTVNDDKSVTANGTNSTSNYANIIVFKGELEGGTYTLTGAVSDVFRIRLGMGTSADGYGAYVGLDKGNGYTFTVAGKALYTVTCQVESGKTASNVIFKPMLRYADIIDDTYEPYQPSVQEQINALEARIAALGG